MRKSIYILDLRKVLSLVAVVLSAAVGPNAHAQGPAGLDPDLFRELEWRSIGPHRTSRTKALDGVPSQPHTFYIGVVNGGVWKTTDGGRTFTPFAGRPVATTIRRLGSNPSNPDILALTSDQGAGGHAERRRVVEQLVQPGDGRLLPCDDRQFVPLSRVQRSAGKRLGMRPEPWRSWADYVA